jgi:hypothetical protein
MSWTRGSVWLVVLVAAVGTLALPAAARAQVVTFEAVGERALGMGGAFVAVADDATAVAWNPAGLAAAGPAGMTIGWHRLQVGNPDAVPGAGVRRQHATLTSLGSWPIGISYGTVTVSDLIASPNGGDLVARASKIGQVGVSILQSVFPGVVVGSTLKVLRGASAIGPVDGATAGDALTAAVDLASDRRLAFDLDVSVLASAPKARIGLTLKNLRSPDFDDDPATETPLPRQARLGVAILPSDGVTLAMDVDLNTVDLTGGLQQNVAVGAETALGSRLSVRSGVRWSLKGARRPIGAIGASVRIRRALWLDGHYATGRSDEAREGGIALRAGF